MWLIRHFPTITSSIHRTFIVYTVPGMHRKKLELENNYGLSSTNSQRVGTPLLPMPFQAECFPAHNSEIGVCATGRSVLLLNRR